MEFCNVIKQPLCFSATWQHTNSQTSWPAIHLWLYSPFQLWKIHSLCKMVANNMEACSFHTTLWWHPMPDFKFTHQEEVADFNVRVDNIFVVFAHKLDKDMFQDLFSSILKNIIVTIPGTFEYFSEKGPSPISPIFHRLLRVGVSVTTPASLIGRVIHIGWCSRSSNAKVKFSGIFMNDFVIGISCGFR